MSHLRSRPISESLQEYGRGIAGGLLFSLPLLYTMEVWWTGFMADPTTLLICIVITFLLLLGYNRYGGMRPGTKLHQVAIDSIEELGLGLILSALVLYLLGQITHEMPVSEVVGKIVLEAMLVAVGISVGTAQLGQSQEEHEEGEASNDFQEHSHYVGQLVLSFCGAILFAANVAPTEEIVVVAIESSAWKLLGLAIATLLVGALILHYSGFVGSQEKLFSHDATRQFVEPLALYAVALLASALMLWLFRRFDDVSWATCLRETVVLAFAGNLGAAAGRLLIQ